MAEQAQMNREDRIRTLAERLVTTEKELEALLRGQADAVMVGGGTLLLRKAQAALRESQARYHRLVEHLAAMVIELMPDGTVLYVNDPVCVVTGFRRDELRGRNWWDTFFPDGEQRQVQELYRLLEAGDVTNHEMVMTMRDGRRVPLELSTANHYGEGGQLERIVAFAMDVTERRRAEEKLRQAAVVFESTPNAVLITDSERRIVAVNGAFTNITGFAPEEAIGRNPRLQKSGRHGEEFYQSIWRSIEEIGMWQGEIWNRRKNGEIYPAWENISAVTDEQGRVVNYVAVFSDISKIKESAEKLDYMAHHDPLTDVANRLLFFARLESAIEHAKRRRERLALLFLDLDRFKAVNDLYGHEAGDRMLQEVARRIKGNVRAEDTVARVGGDEFVVLMNNPEQPQDAAVLADKIIRAIERPIAFDGHESEISMTIGISIYPDDANEGRSLVRAADTAMYSAKREGGRKFRFSTAELNQQTLERFSLENDLHGALARGELSVAYQPVVSLSTCRPVGVEALARWRHPTLGVIPPEQFIPIAEEAGMIDAIGEWVLRTACTQARVWRDAGMHPFRLSVNLSGRQILQEGIVAQVQEAILASEIEPCELELEVTESVLQNAREAAERLNRLHGLGVRIAIDDFGTGYSSFSQLKRLPIDTLKIDKSFIQDIPGPTNSEAIVTAIIAMGHSMGLKVIAEGVESQAQLCFLRQRDCDELQGGVFSTALPPADIQRLFEESRRLEFDC